LSVVWYNDKKYAVKTLKKLKKERRDYATESASSDGSVYEMG
jgi:hypothetical protein